jgi:DNA repair protein RadC
MDLLALTFMCRDLVIVNNHPSGNLTSKTSDKILTNSVKDDLKLIDILLTDHLIITSKQIF